MKGVGIAMGVPQLKLAVGPLARAGSVLGRALLQLHFVESESTDQSYALMSNFFGLAGSEVLFEECTSDCISLP